PSLDSATRTNACSAARARGARPQPVAVPWGAPYRSGPWRHLYLETFQDQVTWDRAKDRRVWGSCARPPDIGQPIDVLGTQRCEQNFRRSVNMQTSNVKALTLDVGSAVVA